MPFYYTIAWYNIGSLIEGSALASIKIIHGFASLGNVVTVAQPITANSNVAAPAFAFA